MYEIFSKFLGNYISQTSIFIPILFIIFVLLLISLFIYFLDF